VLEGEVLTCERLADMMSITLRDAGCGGEPPLISAGGRGLIGHDSATGPLLPGESIIIDVFPQHLASRMHCDMTRTFCFGPAPDRLDLMYGVVREALRRSSEEICAGVTGRAVWETACDVIEDAGFRTLRSISDGESLSEDFFHSLGHGVGLSVHEAPVLGMGGVEELVAGEALAVEPGVYKAGFGGVRLEDVVIVREDGAELLTDFSYQLEIHP
jgi:Xaa-Pro aminopeptidase